jgi:hypothetical protein
MTKEDKTFENSDFRPDGWERFEKAVDAAVQGGPKHKAAKPHKEMTGKKRPKKGQEKK